MSVHGGITLNTSGLDDLLKDLQKLEAVSEEKILDSIETMAEEFVIDLLKLPRPKSAINAAGYTHMVDSFAAKRDGSDIVVGWGKYYGPFVERGTRRKNYPKQPHLVPLWNQNQEKYIQTVRDAFFK